MGYLALAKAVLQLVNLVVGWASAERERGLGRAEAMAAGLTKATASIQAARAAEAEAEAAHRADATDGAFDADFKRSL